MSVPIPEFETERLDALQRYHVLDTPPEECFDRITRLAANLFAAPISLISMVAKDRVWFKSQVGVFSHEASRKQSFSAWAILSQEVLVVNDAPNDLRFRDSTFLTQDHDLHFYAGAPLITPDGYAIGALCIIDRAPRYEFSDEESRHLGNLAGLIIDQLELRRTTLQLRASEADYRDLFENCPAGIYRTSPGGEILMANPAILRILEYSSMEDLTARNLEFDTMVESRAEWRRLLESGDDLTSFESVWYTRNGRPVQIRESTRVVRRDDGSVSYYEGWAEDITLRKAAEAEWEQARLFNSKLIEAVPDVIYIFDLDTDRTVFSNRCYFDIIGQDPEVVRQLENPINELVHPDDIPRLRKHRSQIRGAREGEFFELSFRLRDLSGNYRMLSCRETVFSWKSDGSAKELLGVMRNITERRAMEERLRRDEDRWQLVLAANNDGLWDWDARTAVVFHSPRWREMLGYLPDDPADPESWAALLHPDDAEWVKRGLASYLSRESPAYQQEYRLRGKDGNYRWVLARGVAQWDSEGNPIRMVGSHSDITERKQAEFALRQQAKELAEARDKAESAAEAKSSFLATMSHEIRTPLNGILGMTGILAETELTAEQHDYVRTIRSSGSTLLAVINDILDFSKIESGHMELEKTEFDLRTEIEESLDLVAEAADRKGLELASWIEPAIPLTIRGDAVRLRQILLNLLSNAVKFTAHGEIVLTVKIENAGTGLVLHFAVSDTGIGMSPEVCARVFTAFSQADASTTRRFGGTGLGLTISKQLVELMEGRIGVDSVAGAGSIFWFQIPLVAGARTATRSNGDEFVGRRVLVADDNSTNLRIVENMLQSLGVTVVCARDGAEALSLLRKSEEEGKKIDLGLLDFHMPLMDGLTLSQEIRAQKAFESLPLVLLTSVTQREHLLRTRDLDIQAYLIKPLHTAQLLQCVRSFLLPNPAEQASRTVRPPSAPAPKRMNTGGRVLLAEDNPVNQKVGVLMLTRLGYEVDVVGNGKEAVEAFRKLPYHAILLDCQMPEMDGFEATRLIREMEGAQSHIAIIALTANALSGERERCLKAGMDDYLSKPVSQKLLGEALAAVVRQDTPAL